MEELAREQKEQMFIEFETKQAKRLRTGKIIVNAIASVNILMTIFHSIFVSFNLFPFIIQIVLSIALMSGVAWVRYLFAVGAALGAMLILYILAVGAYFLSPALIIFSIVVATYGIVCSALLFTSKCVSEYIYAVKY